jgi:hypothetical protein
LLGGFWIYRWWSKQLWVGNDGVGQNLDDDLLQRIVAFCKAMEEEI